MAAAVHHVAHVALGNALQYLCLLRQSPHCHKTLWEAEGKDSVEGATVNFSFNVLLIDTEINRATLKTVSFKYLQI